MQALIPPPLSFYFLTLFVFINLPSPPSPKALEELEKKAKEMGATMQKSLIKLAKNQRRAPGRLVPVPLPTLARLQEDSGEVYLLHDHRQFLTAGDVVRFGSVLGRDYIVGMRSKALQNSAPKTIAIEPAYDLVGEEEFDAPTAGRSLLVGPPATDARGREILPPYSALGFSYSIPASRKPFDLAGPLDAEIRLKKKGKVVTERTVGSVVGAGGEASPERELDASLVRAGRPTPKGGERDPGGVWEDVWVWKCIPADEDTRPPWRIAYDDGLVRYDFQYRESTNFASFFRVHAPLRLMEAFCTDVRCPDMSLYAQRADMMAGFEVRCWPPSLSRALALSFAFAPAPLLPSPHISSLCF